MSDLYFDSVEPPLYHVWYNKIHLGVYIQELTMHKDLLLCVKILAGYSRQFLVYVLP